MPTDKQRLDFLESLLSRTVFINKGNPTHFVGTDIHVSGPDSCSIYARAGVGSSTEFTAHGTSVRQAIDEAMDVSQCLKYEI